MEHPQHTNTLKLSEEQIEEIKEHAHDLLGWKDIAYLMSIPLFSFKAEFDNSNSILHIAYHTGRIERKKALRSPVLKLAEAGSPQAEILANEFLQEQLLSEEDE